MPSPTQRKPSGRGGARPGAGRPRKPGAVSHVPRPAFTTPARVQIVLRRGPGVPSLREARTGRVIREVLAAADHDGFRVVESQLLANQLELVIDAADTRALSRGMQGLSIRLARRVNAVLDRRGALWSARYEARVLPKRR